MKSCKNCGSPIMGYRDYCGGFACEASRKQNEEEIEEEEFENISMYDGKE